MVSIIDDVWPVFSRAVNDDDDEECIAEACCPAGGGGARLTLDSGMPDNKLHCLMIVVAVGPAAVAFTDTYIRNSGYRLVGTISSGYQQDGCRGGAESERESLADVSRIYCGEMESPVVLCLCDVDVAQADMFAWVDQLFSGLATDGVDVVVLNTSPTSCFVGDIPTSEMPTPFLRCLLTDHCFPVPDCSRSLEQPNLISGLAAQMMTYCVVHSMKAVLHQCYTDYSTGLADVSTVKAFLPLLQCAPLDIIIQAVPKDADQRLQALADKHVTGHTLYL